MGRKVGLNIGLGSYRRGVRRQSLIVHTRRRVRDPFRETSKGEEAHQSAAGCPGRGACWTPRSWWAAGQVLLLVLVLLRSVESSGPARYKMCEKGGRTGAEAWVSREKVNCGTPPTLVDWKGLSVVRSPQSAGAGWELELGSTALGNGMEIEVAFWRQAVWGSPACASRKPEPKNGASIRVLLLGVGELAAGSFLDMEVGASRQLTQGFFSSRGKMGGRPLGEARRCEGVQKYMCRDVRTLGMGGASLQGQCLPR